MSEDMARIRDQLERMADAEERTADEQERAANALESIAGVLKLANESGLLGRMNTYFEYIIADREGRQPML